jgi:ubiquinone/menaquinone biosynthesis C-methylase UbiE
MKQDAPAARKYGDADGYDAYMGGWSAALAPLFLDFAGGAAAAVLDVGCGTGNLLHAAAAAFPGARLVGIDPSARLLGKARSRPELAGVELILGVAERLPFDGGTFDHCLSLLVMQEFPDPAGALAEMRRVSKTGGIVAGCQWDFSQMPVIDALVEAITAVAPVVGARLGGSSYRVLENEADFQRAWATAGFREVTAGRIRIVRAFRDFDQLWRPLLAGSTPSTMTLATLRPDERDAVRSRMTKRFCGASPDVAFTITAEAMVVRGLA